MCCGFETINSMTVTILEVGSVNVNTIVKPGSCSFLLKSPNSTLKV